MNFYRRKKVSWFILSFLFIICTFLLFLTASLAFYRVNAEQSYDAAKWNEDDIFQDDSIIIVLEQEVSQYRGVASEIEEQPFRIGASEIIELAPLPENYLTTNGEINQNR